MGGAAIPITQLMAFSYAALQPSGDLLNKYLNEIEKLEAKGNISERDHQLLRSSPLASTELMNLTLGDDELLTEETVTEILERVTSEIRGGAVDIADQAEMGRVHAVTALEEEERRSEQLERERMTTERALAEQTTQNYKMRSNLYWECRKRAKLWARGISVGLAIFLIGIILVSSLEFVTLSPAARWLIVGALAILTATNLLYGLTVKGIYNWLEETLRTKIVRRRAKTLGIELEGFDTI